MYELYSEIKSFTQKDSLNKIDKGQAVNLYEKTKPTNEKIVAFADKPPVNPETGKRSGLKGTRKDGLVNAVSFGLFRDITPSIMRKLDKPAADIAKTAEKLEIRLVQQARFSGFNISKSQNVIIFLYSVERFDANASKE